MINTTKVGTIAVTAFSAGYFLGAVASVKAMRKRFDKVQPLVVSSLTNILVKFQEDEMTYDEIRDYAANELNFIKIVTKG